MHHRYLRNRSLLAVIAFGLIACLGLPSHSAWAATPLTQGYAADNTIPTGSMVSLSQNSTNHVEPTGTKNVGNLLGVVVDTGTSPLTLSSGSAIQAQVATSGTEMVLVTDINGKVEAGDPITASSINGVGMKATNNAKVIGVAQGPMVGMHKESYTDANGAKQTATLGQAPVLVNVSYFYKQPDKTLIPAALQNVANTLAGKPVSPLPIIISSAIFLITLIVVAAIVYSMIRSSIISVGRNPMAQSAVYRDIIQLSAVALGILSVAVISIYLILTKL